MTLIDKFFNQQLGGLTRAMDLSQRRNEVIASNIANADTPGFKAGDLDFSGELKKAFGEGGDKNLLRTNSKHLGLSSTDGSAHIVEDHSGAMKADGNNVDIDVQMGQLAQNAGRYTSAATLIRKQLGLIKLAIREGGR